MAVKDQPRAIKVGNPPWAALIPAFPKGEPVAATLEVWEGGEIAAQLRLTADDLRELGGKCGAMASDVDALNKESVTNCKP